MKTSYKAIYPFLAMAVAAVGCTESGDEMGNEPAMIPERQAPGWGDELGVGDMADLKADCDASCGQRAGGFAEAVCVADPLAPTRTPACRAKCLSHEDCPLGARCLRGEPTDGEHTAPTVCTPER